MDHQRHLTPTNVNASVRLELNVKDRKYSMLTPANATVQVVLTVKHAQVHKFTTLRHALVDAQKDK